MISFALFQKIIYIEMGNSNSDNKKKDTDVTLKETKTTTYCEKDGNRTQEFKRELTISTADPSQMENVMKNVPCQNSYGSEMGQKYGSVLAIQM